MDKDLILISVACIYRDYRGRRQWLVAKEKDDGEWELPRMLVRKTESSARASIRLAGEQLGLNIQILEEAGRAGGVATVNNEVVKQRYLYYLAVKLDPLEDAEALPPVSFNKIEWLVYAQAIRRLPAKRDRQMLKAAQKELKTWLRIQKEEEKKIPK